MKKQKNDQAGGCGCGQSNYSEQQGGAYKELPPEALDKAKIWRDEVKAVQNELGITYKQALQEASKRRKENDDQYKTMEQRYVEHLDSIRQSDKKYHPYGSKNKRPLSFEAAQRLLLQYYKERADQYKKGPLTAMKKKISSCHADPKRTLIACPPGIKSKKDALEKAPECVGSWKYRPGKHAKGATGPGYYDIEGLDNLCGPEKAQMRKESKLYNMKKPKTSTQKGGSGDFMTNPFTGRPIKIGGETHKKVIEKTSKLKNL
jgi:hypothetical protein